MGLPGERLLPARLRPERVRSRLGRSRLGQRLALSVGRELRPQRWIFIVGCYNSGTTLLGRILGRHPDIGTLPAGDEGVFFTDALPYPEQFGWPRMWAACPEQIRVDPQRTSPRVGVRARRQWSPWYRRDAPNLLEKSVSHTIRMPYLERYFPPAYFIHIVRDGYAVAEGIRRRARPGRWGNTRYPHGYPIELCAEQWRASEEVVAADAPRLAHFMELTYEDLTAHPEPVLRSVTDFLGLSPLPAELFATEWQVHERREPIRNLNEQSHARLSAADIATIERVAGARLALRGYRTPGDATTAR